VMAGEQSPESIRRSEVVWKLTAESGQAPLMHEVDTAMGGEGDSQIRADRRATFARERVVMKGSAGNGQPGGSKLAEVRAAYDLTDDEYQRWLADRDSRTQPGPAAEPTPDDSGD